MLRFLPITLLFVYIACSCERDNITGHHSLSFSDDTIHFDTVFSTIGSTTRELRVRNALNSSVRIDEVFLAGGEDSQFRLNIDGEPVNISNGLFLEKGDSLFIFIDVVIDPTDQNSPVAVTDSIIFRIGSEILSVKLLAWGQDIFLLKNEKIGNEVWYGTKPYVIYGNVTVDTAETLTIEKGVRILFHRNSTLVVAGSLVVNGTEDSSVLFATDRLEKMFEDIPGQWNGIKMLNTSSGNYLSHAIIRNSVYGIRIGDPMIGQGTPGLKLFYSDISHSSVSGLNASNATIESANCVFSHCGSYCIIISSGGDYTFTHCTVSNSWDYGFRLTPAVYVSEKPLTQGGITTQLIFEMRNSVIFGDLRTEIEIIPKLDIFTGSYYFDHCLLKIDTTASEFWVEDIFPGFKINTDPGFINSLKLDFRPDTLSPLIDAGNDLYINLFPFDFRKNSRYTDSKPDIGAYERIPGEEK